MKFAIRHLVVVTTVVSLYCALVFGVPAVVGLIGLSVLNMLLPPIIAGGAIYGRGATRAFWIGCACGFPAYLLSTGLAVQIILAIADISTMDGVIVITGGMAICHMLVFLSGLVVLVMRWLHLPAAEVPNAADAPYSIVHQRVAVQTPADSGARVPRPSTAPQGSAF